MRLALAALPVAAMTLFGCSNAADSEATPVSVTSSQDTCDVAPTEAKAGTIVFSIQNTGSQPTEFYLYGQGDEVIAELENIGPGVARDLVAEVQAGQYTTACKPGMTGEGIRGSFTVQ